MRSTSSLAKEFLLTLPAGYRITNLELWGDLRRLNPGEEVTIGAVGGFMSKLARDGLVEQQRIGREVAYTISPETGAKLASVIVRGRPGDGSQRGREDGAHRPVIRRSMTREAMRDKLLELATQVEAMRLDLSQLTIKELLAELMRREKNGEHE